MAAKMPSSHDYEAVYMDRRAVMYMREYVRCEGDFGGSVFENLDTVHTAARLKNAGILESFTGPVLVRNEELGTVTERWEEHTAVLSPLGEYLKELHLELYSRKSAFEFNFWTMRAMLDIWPLKWLEEASAHQHRQRETPSTHVVTNFMSVFQMEFPLDPSARQYLRDRIRVGAEDPIRKVALPEQFVAVTVQVDRSKRAPTTIEDDFSFGEGVVTALDSDGFPMELPQPDLEDAADFDFGSLPDEEAGEQDFGAGEDDFPDDGPMLTPEEESDGWKV